MHDQIKRRLFVFQLKPYYLLKNAREAMKNKTKNLPKPKYRMQSLIALISLILMLYIPSIYAVDVDGKVQKDLLKLNSFNATTTIIANRPLSEVTTIGADGACDVDSALSGIQDVINTGVAEIRVASNGSYLNNLTIDNQSVVIRGGFVDCTDAANNIQTINDFTLIDGSLMAAPVIRITGVGLADRQVVRLENIILGNGTSSGSALGGGLSLDETELELQMLRVLISQNSGPNAAGVNVDNGPGTAVNIDVFAQDVIITSNDAQILGGGLYCIGTADMTFTGMSSVINNTAQISAGVTMQAGCQISFYSEILPGSLFNIAGLSGNKSLFDGGGAWVIGGSDLFLFGQEMCLDGQCLGSSSQPIQVVNNRADVDDNGTGHGGGIHLIGTNSEVYANGIIMSGNSAGENGGGIYVEDNATASIERISGACWNKDRCNLIIDNQSGDSIGFGGAFHVDGAELNLSQSYVEENRADFGTAISAVGEDAVVTVEGTVFDDNGNEGADGFSDFQVVNASLGATIAVRHSTFAANDATNTVFNIDPALGSSMSLLSSIVWDVGSGNLFSGASGSLVIDCLVAHESGSFSGTNVVVANPSFVDVSSGDFHLSSNSPAIDLCQGIPMNHPLDIDQEPRGWDDPDNANEAGIFDAGADESYVNDVIFENGFEA